MLSNSLEKWQNHPWNKTLDDVLRKPSITNVIVDCEREMGGVFRCQFVVLHLSCSSRDLYCSVLLSYSGATDADILTCFMPAIPLFPSFVEAWKEWYSRKGRCSGRTGKTGRHCSGCTAWGNSRWRWGVVASHICQSWVDWSQMFHWLIRFPAAHALTLYLLVSESLRTKYMLLTHSHRCAPCLPLESFWKWGHYSFHVLYVPFSPSSVTSGSKTAPAAHKYASLFASSPTTQAIPQ